MDANTAENRSSNGTSPGSFGSGPDFAAIFQLAKAIVMTPVQAWHAIKARNEGITDIYKQYLIYLAAIPAICGLIGQLVIGISIPFYGTWRPPVFSAVFTSVINYVLSLAAVYVVAMIIEALSPRFEGNASRTDGFKLVAYSMTPAYLAGVLSLIPVLGILGLFAAFYGLYIYYKGIPIMGAASENKQSSFFFVSVGCFILTGIALSVIHMLIVPTPELPADIFKNIGTYK